MCRKNFFFTSLINDKESEPTGCKIDMEIKVSFYSLFEKSFILYVAILTSHKTCFQIDFVFMLYQIISKIMILS